MTGKNDDRPAQTGRAGLPPEERARRRAADQVAICAVEVPNNVDPVSAVG